jgi:hypothetical protein
MHVRLSPHVAVPCVGVHWEPAAPGPLAMHSKASGAAIPQVWPLPHWNGSALHGPSGPHAAGAIIAAKAAAENARERNFVDFMVGGGRM